MNRLFPINAHGVLCTLLLCLLLTSCGTALWQVPYYAGGKGPSVRKASGEYTPTKHGTFDLDIHRISGAYYAKIEVFHFPYEKPYVLWNGLTGYPDTPWADTTKGYIQSTCYCLLNNEECSKLHLPAIPAPQAGAKPAPAVLSDRAAAKLQPESVCTRRVDWLPQSLPWKGQHSIIHYPLLPVSAATFVAVDVPCTVIATVGTFLFITVADAICH